MTKLNFEKLKEQIELSGDTNACSVIATSVAMEEDIKMIQAMYSKRGRKKGRGVSEHLITKIVELLAKDSGWKVKKYVDHTKLMNRGESLRELTDGKTLTPTNCHQYLDENKNYLMMTSSHAIGVTRNKVIDWTQGRKHRVEILLEIDKGITTGLQNWVASL